MKDALKIISENQGAFVDSCQILDSVLIAQLYINSRKQAAKPWMEELDFENAYDMVDWGFLQYMLAHLGFGE